MSFISLLQKFKYAKSDGYVRLGCAESVFGLTTPALAEHLRNYPYVWQQQGDMLVLNDTSGTDIESRTQAVDEVLRDLSAQGILPPEPDYSAFGGTDWVSVRDETQASGDALFTARRFYARYLGVVMQSIVLNGYEDGHYWCARRSKHVHYDPGKYDILTAGMIKHGHTLEQSLLDEGRDECGLEYQHLPFVKQSNEIYVAFNDANGFIWREIFNVFDFDTANRFVPNVVNPVEIENFSLLPFARVAAMTETGQEFCRFIHPVVIDFLFRHGHIAQDHPDYATLKELIARKP